MSSFQSQPPFSDKIRFKLQIQFLCYQKDLAVNPLSFRGLNAPSDHNPEYFKVIDNFLTYIVFIWLPSKASLRNKGELVFGKTEIQVLQMVFLFSLL